jgi:tetratricopeptide (TPR) repeat protein
MISVAAYLRYLDDRKAWRYSLVCASLALGLMAKPMVTTLPAVLLLLDYWPLGRLRFTSDAGPGPSRAGAGISPLLLEKLPLFALSLASGIVTLVAQDLSGAVKPSELYSVTTRLANAAVSYATYVAKAVWPARLALFYPHRGDTLTALQVLGTAAFLAAATVLVIRRSPRSPYLGVGWLWFLLALLPVIGIVQVGSHALADRYTYVPLIGLAVMVAWGAPELAGRWLPQRRLATLACAVVVVLAALTRHQLAHWRTSETVMAHAVAVTDGNWLAHHNLGLSYLGQGKLPEAAAQLEAALGLKPGFAKARLSLGNVFAAMGRFADAEREYRRALQLRPDMVEAYNNLGKTYLDQKRFDEAYACFQQVFQRGADLAEAHYNAGIALSGLGRPGEAIAEYQAAIRIKPSFVEPRINLGNVLDDAGRFPEAVEQYQAAIGLRPADPTLHYNLALALDRGGAKEEAIRHYRETLRLDPGLAQARFRLEALLRRR